MLHQFSLETGILVDLSDQVPHLGPRRLSDMQEMYRAGRVDYPSAQATDNAYCNTKSQFNSPLSCHCNKMTGRQAMADVSLIPAWHLLGCIIGYFGSSAQVAAPNRLIDETRLCCRHRVEHVAQVDQHGRDRVHQPTQTVEVE